MKTGFKISVFTKIYILVSFTLIQTDKTVLIFSINSKIGPTETILAPIIQIIAVTVINLAIGCDRFLSITPAKQAKSANTVTDMIFIRRKHFLSLKTDQKFHHR